MAQGRHNNNFDLLRILAALEVFAMHSAEHLKLDAPVAVAILNTIPGVPIFFVISGFLVSESYERSSLGSYAVKRALRIYPGLWGCLAVSVAIAAAFGVSMGPGFWPWLAAQVSIAQFYNPVFLRAFGVGVLNGSLWTIPVELQFYIALPLIYRALRTNRAILIAIALGMALNVTCGNLRGESLAQKMLVVTLPPYLYMFLLGVFLQRNSDLVTRYLTGRLPLWLGAYVALQAILFALGWHPGGNWIDPLSETVLACVVVSAAFARPAIQPRGDVSYGLYLYHMPMINAFVHAGRFGWGAASLALIAATASAVASWVLIEKPAMALKRFISRPRAVHAINDDLGIIEVAERDGRTDLRS